MTALRQKLQQKEWRKDQYLVSTDLSLIPLDKVNEALASDRLYWAKAVPTMDSMYEMLENSLCFALYDTTKQADVVSASFLRSGKSEHKLIGFGRCITDFVTFAYLTDVYVDEDQQGTGLGKWLLSCIREVTDAMPYLRRTLLFTGDWKRSVPFYQHHLGMHVMHSKQSSDGRSGEGVAVMARLGKGNPEYVADTNA